MNFKLNLPADWRFCQVAYPKASGDALKRPFETNWQNKPYTAEEIKTLLHKGRCQNYGLLFGHAGLIGLDVDGDRAHQRLMEIAEGNRIPDTVGWTSGKPGRYHLLFCLNQDQEAMLQEAIEQTGEPDKGRWFERFNVDGKQQDLDFRWKGCQSLLPPSLHPEGKRYQWLNAPSELAVAVLPDWLFNHLLSLVLADAPEYKEPEVKQTELNWTSFDKAFRLPIAETVPLEICLAKSSRDALNGVSQGGRNDAGAKLARDLIGTASYLESVGQRYDGNPEQLFEQFCNGCNPPLKPSESATIWKSAQKGNPGASLSPEKIEGCVKAWHWKQLKQEQAPPKQDAKPEPKESKPEAKQEPKTIDRQSIDNEAQRLTLDLQFFLKETHPVQRQITLNRICSIYRLTKQVVSDLIAAVEEENNPKERYRFGGGDFFNQESDAIDYLIPRYLPIAESILLCSDAGVGKSALVTDMIHAVLSGTQFLGQQLAKKGKCLVVSSDESPRSTRRRFIARGIDLCVSGNNLEVWTRLDITKLDDLERYLEDERPDVVFIDSITTVCQNLGINEKDPEFARYLYKLKNLVNRYNSALVVIHHANKDPLAKGLKRISGSARIPAAFWGVFLLERWDNNNEDNPYRVLSMVKSRETETFKSKLVLKQRHDWMTTGIFGIEDESGAEREYQGRAQQILSLLARHSPNGLEYQEIAREVGVHGNYLYRVLDRLEDSRMIGKRRSATDKRRWVYFVPDTPPSNKLHLVEEYPQTNAPQDFQPVEETTPFAATITPPPPVGSSINEHCFDLSEAETSQSLEPIEGDDEEMGIASNLDAVSDAECSSTGGIVLGGEGSAQSQVSGKGFGFAPKKRNPSLFELDKQRHQVTIGSQVQVYWQNQWVKAVVVAFEGKKAIRADGHLFASYCFAEGLWRQLP